MPDNKFSDIIHLDPNTIQVSRENRQRKEINLDNILDSIKTNGIINPIIIQKIPPAEGSSRYEYHLIAGERRLEACKKLNIQVPCRFYDSLNSFEIQLIEFEENHKRKNLNWREEVLAIANLYNLGINQIPPLIKSQIANNLSLSEQKLDQILHLHKFIDEKILTFAENYTQAVNLINRFKSQKTEELKTNLRQILESKPIPEYLKPVSKTLNLDFEFEKDIKNAEEAIKERNLTSLEDLKKEFKIQPNPILNIDFKLWIKDYSGPKFNFIHVDFPQSEKNFWPCLDLFIKNIDKIIDNQAHILFWLNMDYYLQAIEDLSTLAHDFENDWEIVKQPLIWYKTDTKDNRIFGEPPKSTYETALILIHNNRPFKKQIQNAYHTPRATQPICPNQKSLPMLKYFLSTFIDKNTNVLDPTCGSGSSLLVAEELGAKSILGLEIDSKRSQKANEKISRGREIRKLLDK